ncbi:MULTISPECIES: hypothetical protein [Novosphingobium]|uniref:hypothetical protein n=1 Tax=Novosphingobium TaxID=165696 RepID=UPI001CD5D5A3|nr:hypothetical protein [Novosphingobium percolationis]MCH7629413.1 hypothetical protein [Pseudomonadota bacterium]
MPVTYAGDCAMLEGQCVVEEAAELTEWLLADRARGIDLAACTGLHSALLQTIMALTPPLRAAPVDALLARWLAPVMPPVQPAPSPRPKRAPAAKAATTSPRNRRTRKATAS